MKTIVTGGGGFLGRFVCRKLRDEGHSVTILGRGHYEFAEREKFPVITADISDGENLQKAFQGFDEVHHIAARTGISVFREPYFKTNVLGTENVVKACLRNGVGKLVFTSSPSVIFGGSDQQMLIESAPYPEKYLSCYSETKALAERIVLAANQPGKLLTVALRPHLIWGPEDTNLIPRLLERAAKKKLFTVGNGKNMADVTHVENVAYAHLLASRKLTEGSAICGKAYFITNGEPVNLWDFINRIITGMGHPAVARKMPLSAAYCIGFAMESVYRALGIRSEPLMTRFLALQLATSHCYSIEAAQRDLGYKPVVSVDAGLASLIEHLRKKTL
ncbi:MAG: NAD-dependent epimerase/dehydratase family protein [Candidatus Wallbacteria bacterium]|nr:NAD-dependent epimerase/dehydratase family protein [Candidatus Wallbacteria bacterium]